MAEVLVADDEPAMLKTLRVVLEHQGLQVQTAVNGREVLQALCRKTATGENFDAIILDIKMPEVDGWQVLRAMQSNPLWREIPVVVISGYVHGARDYASVSRMNGVLVEKKEDFHHVVSAVVQRVLASGQHRAERLLWDKLDLERQILRHRRQGHS